MDSPLSCPDSLGLPRTAACIELTTCYQLFSFGRDWNKQSQALIHNARAMSGGISGVIKYSPGDIFTFHTLLEFAGDLALGAARRLALETCQEPQVRSPGSLSYGSGRNPRGFGCSIIPICPF